MFRTLGDAHGDACQLRRAIDLEALGHEKSLTVVERDRTEQDVQPFTAQRPCQPARDDVDVAGAVKEIDRGDRLVPNPLGRPDDGGRYGAADVDVEAGIVALAVHPGEPGDPREDTADEEAALADARHARSRSSAVARCRQHGGDEERRDGPPHDGEGGHRVYNVLALGYGEPADLGWQSVREQCQHRTQSYGSSFPR